jgi:hypothetical protein
MKSSHALYVTVASLALVSGAAIKRDEYANFFDGERVASFHLL